MIIRVSKLEMMKRRIKPWNTLRRPYPREFAISVKAVAKWNVLGEMIKEEFPEYYCRQGKTEQDGYFNTAVMTHDLVSKTFDPKLPGYKAFTVTAHIGRAHPSVQAGNPDPRSPDAQEA